MEHTFKEEVVRKVGAYLEKGVGFDVSRQRYDQTAREYDTYMKTTNYEGPSELGVSMKELYPTGRQDVKILDVASGTGLSGEALWECGFRHIDAVDPSQGMLDVAKEKNVYQRIICDFLDDKHKLDIPENTYDAVTIVGGMGENQLPSGAFGEMCRVVKPGGVIVNVTRVEHYKIVDDYVTNLAPYFRKLEDDGIWKEESSRTFPNFIMGRQGTASVHRVLA